MWEICVCEEKSVCKWLSGRVGEMTVHKLGVHISHSIYIYVYGVGYDGVVQVFFSMRSRCIPSLELSFSLNGKSIPIELVMFTCTYLCSTVYVQDNIPWLLFFSLSLSQLRISVEWSTQQLLQANEENAEWTHNLSEKFKVVIYFMRNKTTTKIQLALESKGTVSCLFKLLFCCQGQTLQNSIRGKSIDESWLNGCVQA